MKKLIVLACLATTVSLTATAAMADSIKGKLGVTGKMGFILPADNDAENRHNNTDAGFITGGGLIYGIDNHFAAELEVTRAFYGSDSGDFEVTNFSFGGQYRIAMSDPKLVPYLGAGIDILATDYDPDNGLGRDVATKVGVHASAGVDYFLLQNLALTAEAKLVVAPDANINNNGGKFDPSSLSTTAGIRFFFN